MSVTSPWMRDARDAEDALLLQHGRHAELLAAYHEVVVQRCLIAARVDGEEVAQRVFLRLWEELSRGKRYAVPFRVVVHKVVGWTVKAHCAGRPDAPLPDDWDPADDDDPYAPFEQDYDLERLWAGLPDGSRAVLDLRYREGLEIDEIAERLGKSRNAVDQSLHRAHATLREVVRAA